MQGSTHKAALRSMAAALCVLALASCGRYFSAEVAGYVKDSESASGINGAVVRMYSSEPQSADAGGFIVETASASSGGNAGYYNHRVIWQNALPAFGAEGDTTSFWLGITHADYLDALVEIRGILSGTLNFVPDVTLFRAGFSVPSVSGRVVDPAGEGINGVRVVLDLASTDEVDDYVTVTTTIDGETGRYRFNDVSWRNDEAAGQGSDTEEAEVYVDDRVYVAVSDALIILLSSDQAIEVAEEIVAASDRFTTPRVSGVVQRAGKPQNGVRVVLALASTDNDEDYVTTTRTIDGQAGTYEFLNVSWTDETAMGSVTDTEPVSISVSDNTYESGTVIEVEIESGQESRIQVLPVTRMDPTSSSTTIVGRCLSRTVSATDIRDVPARGIEVTLRYTDDDGTHTLYDHTDVNGSYSFLIQWTNATPDPTVPAGEDTIVVEIEFEEPFNAKSFTIAETYNARVVKSWLDPNYIPDVVVAE